MGIRTDIGYTDSSANAVMGCDGCELWNPEKNVRKCYAGRQTTVYTGRKGWPKSFESPELFIHRIQEACDWPDLTGKERPDKPWLNGYPRLIFFNDMSDTFTESLPRNWLLPYIKIMEDSPHIWQFITKRPSRMAHFFNEDLGYVPDNFWLGTTVTSQDTAPRMKTLLDITAKVHIISIEPMLGPIDLYFPERRNVQVICGGESGPGTAPMNKSFAKSIRDQCEKAGAPFFFKQWGGRTKINGIWGGNLLEGKQYHKMPEI